MVTEATEEDLINWGGGEGASTSYASELKRTNKKKKTNHSAGDDKCIPRLLRNRKNMETTIMSILMCSERATTDYETTLKHFIMVIQMHSSPPQGKNLSPPITTTKKAVSSHLLTPNSLHHFVLINMQRLSSGSHSKSN